MQGNDTAQRGFTLIELSIVLCVIALLIGGVVVGKSLIRSSQLLSVTVDEEKYKHAVVDFQQKYGALPGDMAKATSYWGAAGGNSSDNYTTSCYGSQGTGTQTCNGNGNGQIGRFDSSAEWNEMFRVWQHLSNAGFIEAGAYTGVTDSNYHHIMGQNCPASKIKGAGFGLFYAPLSTLPSTWFPNITQGHDIFFGADCSPYEPCGPALTPAEASSIDKKSDDGLPGSGNIMTQNSNYGGGVCTTTTDPTTAQYNVTNTVISCPLQFKTGF